MRFTYSSGSRPLDGFTLKRGVGRGGFGEVYFGVSDGGKEVALKLLRGESEVERRGIELCLNLKHPNLVHLYDLRTDAQGDRWVVMEYVAVESLSTVIGRHPAGLAPELAREWFLGMARAIAYLHDHGIVHRDLKPANVFLENGIIKVGDYGLSKNLNSSHGTPNTQSVGTVHYMAPEISTGKYTRQIDVYAAGVILFEMLTGRVPFAGESAGEILMKHLTATPDLNRVPKDWQPVVGKALAKDPAKRYATITELAADVEAVGSSPKCDAESATCDVRSATVNSEVREAPHAGPPLVPAVSRAAGRVPSGRWFELCVSMGLAVLFTFLSVPLSVTMRWVTPRKGGIDSSASYMLTTVFVLTVLACWLILVPAKLWMERRGDQWTRRLVMLLLGGLLGLTSIWLSGQWSDIALGPDLDFGWTVPSILWTEAGALTFYALGFFVLRWWRLADRKRPRRFALGPVLAALIWGLILTRLVHLHPWHGTLVLVLAAIIVQLVSPWEEPPPPVERKVRWRLA